MKMFHNSADFPNAHGAMIITGFPKAAFRNLFLIAPAAFGTF
jgi:hypothetical protein